MYIKKTQYDEKYHISRLLKLCERGKTILQIATDFGVPQRIIYYWESQHEKFKEAMEIGRQMAFSYYLDLAQEGITNPKNFEFVTWRWIVTRCFNRRFPEIFMKGNYSDKIEIIQEFLNKELISQENAKAWVKILNDSAAIEENTKLKEIIEQLANCDVKYGGKKNEDEEES